MKKNDISFKYPLTLKDITGRHGKNTFVVAIKNDSNKGWGSCWNGQKCPDGQKGKGCFGKIVQIDNNDSNSINHLNELFKKLKEKVKSGVTKISFDKNFLNNLKDKNATAFAHWNSEWSKVEAELLSGTNNSGTQQQQQGPAPPAKQDRQEREPLKFSSGRQNRQSRAENSLTENTNNSNNNSSNSNNSNDSNNSNNVFKKTKKKKNKAAKKSRSKRRERKSKKPSLLATMRKRIKQAEGACDKCKRYGNYIKIETFKDKRYKIAQKFINKLKKAEKMCVGCTKLCKYVKKNIKNPDLRKDKDIFEARYPRLCREINGSIKAKTIKKGLRDKLLEQYRIMNK